MPRASWLVGSLFPEIRKDARVKLPAIDYCRIKQGQRLAVCMAPPSCRASALEPSDWLGLYELAKAVEMELPGISQICRRIENLRSAP